MNSLLKFLSIIVICLTVMWITKEICKCVAAIRLAEAGIIKLPVKGK